MTVIPAKWTIDEYHRMIAAGILGDRRVELLKGEIVVHEFLNHRWT